MKIYIVTKDHKIIDCYKTFELANEEKEKQITIANHSGSNAILRIEEKDLICSSISLTDSFTIKIINNGEGFTWYSIDDTYQVKQCTHRGQLTDMIGVAGFSCDELYIVSSGNMKDCAMLKKHCKKVLDN